MRAITTMAEFWAEAERIDPVGFARARAERAEAEALRKDAERYRYLRNRKPRDVLQTVGAAAGCWIDCEVGGVLTLLTAEDADAQIDADMAAAPAVGDA